MDEKQQLEQQLLIARGIGIGLSAVLSSLLLEHARKLGGTEEALAAAIAIIDKSLEGLSAKGTTTAGETIDRGPEIRRRVKIMINQAEAYARKELGFPAMSKSKH